MTGTVVQISVSAGGVPKTAIEGARVTANGVEGDAQQDTEHHGGPERAVCVYAAEAIAALRAEGHSVAPGVLGENLTVAGLDWPALAPGMRVRVGDALVIEVTRYTSPCWKIASAFRERDYERVSQKSHPGWSRVYARVVVPGSVRRGDRVVVESPSSAESP